MDIKLPTRFKVVAWIDLNFWQCEEISFTGNNYYLTDGLGLQFYPFDWVERMLVSSLSIACIDFSPCISHRYYITWTATKCIVQPGKLHALEWIRELFTADTLCLWQANANDFARESMCNVAAKCFGYHPPKYIHIRIYNTAPLYFTCKNLWKSHVCLEHVVCG